MFEFNFLEVPIVWQKQLFWDRKVINRLLFSTCDFSQSQLCVCLVSKCKLEESTSSMDWKVSVPRNGGKKSDKSEIR